MATAVKRVFRHFVDHTVGELEEDPRFLGLAISGSWVRDEIDEFSDLDLNIICEDDLVPDLSGMQSFAESLGSLVSSFTGEHVGEPTLLICLFDEDPLIHVDLKFSTIAELERRPYDPAVVWERESAISDAIARVKATPAAPNPQWIEDRFWTWIHCAAMRMGRGEVLDLVGFLGFLRDQALGPMALHAAGFPPYGVRKVERYMPEFAIRLRKTIPTYDVASCYEAIQETAEIYRDLRSDLTENVVTNTQAESKSMLYLERVASKIAT